MDQRENKLRAFRFEYPEHIPVFFYPNESVFSHYDPHALEELFESHPIIAGKNRMRWELVPKSPEDIDREYMFYDEFGVKWKYNRDGMGGAVQEHPLEDFSKIPDYVLPQIPEFDLEAERA